MITFSDSEPSSPSQPKHNIMDFDIEPDDEWKKILKTRIQIDMQSMAQDAREDSLAELRSSTPGPEDRKRLEEDYRSRMATIKESASEQYQIELEKERNKRRWMAGEPMLPGWSKYLEEEQQHAFDSFKHGRDQPISPSHLQATFRSLSRATMRARTPSPFPAFSEGDVEPDEEWKKQLCARIQLGFQPKIQHAKDKQLLELRKGMVSPEDRKRVEEEYKAAMANVKALATDEYNFELEKERTKRREKLLHGDRGEQVVAEDIPWTTKSYAIDDESLLKPPMPPAARRESTASQAARDSDLEPDDIWKEKLRLRIQMDLKGMVRTANDTHFTALRKVADAFAQLELEHKEAMDRIQELTFSRYESELAKERLRRRGINDTEEEEEEEDSGESGEDDGEEPPEGGGDDNIFDDEPKESAKEKQERLNRILEETDKREAAIRLRERDVYRREIDAKKKAAEAKLVNDDDIDAIKKKLKEDKVKWKDLDDEEEREDDAELAPVPPEDGEVKTSSASDAASSGQEKARRKQQAIEEQFRDYEANDMLDDGLFADPDPKWIEEQSYIWQQLQYEQQAEMIQRKRQEQRKRQDSVGSSGGSFGSPSSSPVATKMHMPPPVQIPIIPQMPPVNRSHVPVTPWAPVSSLSLAAAAASRAAAVPPSPTIPRKPSLLGQMGASFGSNPMNIPGQHKPRTGSMSSGSFEHPGSSPSPRNVPVIVPPNNLYARVAMVKTRSSSGHESGQ